MPTTFQTFRKPDGDDELWAQAASLFSSNYGVWGPTSSKPGTPNDPTYHPAQHL